MVNEEWLPGQHPMHIIPMAKAWVEKEPGRKETVCIMKAVQILMPRVCFDIMATASLLEA